MSALTLSSLGFALLVNLGVLVLLVCVFNSLRLIPWLRKFYMAKRYLNQPFRYRPPALRHNFIFWWATLYRIPEADVLACAGSDALTYIRFLTLGAPPELQPGFPASQRLQPGIA